MQRIDEFRTKKSGNVKYIEVLDKRSLKIVFSNGKELILRAYIED